jgi:ribosome-binding protein aMBF1 (putative translation factor)
VQQAPDGSVSPVGRGIEAARGARRHSPAYVEAELELAPLEELARLIIAQRIEHGLTQRTLAERMGTSETAISRLESGQHRPSVETLHKLGRALGRRLVIGFEDDSGGRSVAVFR